MNKQNLITGIFSYEKHEQNLHKISRSIDLLKSVSRYLDNELDHQVYDFIEQLEDSAATIEQAMKDFNYE